MTPECPVMMGFAHLGYLVDFSRSQLECACAKHVAHPLLLRARGDGSNVLIHHPPQADFTRIDPVLPRELF